MFDLIDFLRNMGHSLKFLILVTVINNCKASDSTAAPRQKKSENLASNASTSTTTDNGPNSADSSGASSADSSTDSSGSTSTDSSTDSSGSNDGSSSPDSQSVLESQSVVELEATLRSRTNQNNSEAQTLITTNALNETLCTKIKEIRTNCKVASRLVGFQDDRNVECQGLQSETAPKAAVFTAEASGLPDGKDFYFYVQTTATSGQVGPSLSSSLFRNGSTVITFTSVVEEKTSVSPKLNEAFEILVKPSDASVVLPSLNGTSNVSIKLKVDDVYVISKPPALLPPVDSSNYIIGSDGRAAGYKEYRMNTLELIVTSRSSACRVSQSELETIKSQIRQGTGVDNSQSDLQAYKESQDAPAVDYSDPAVKNKLITQILDLETKIALRAPNLTDQQNKGIKIGKLLNTNDGIACHLNDPISKLSFKIKGSIQNSLRLEDGDLLPTLPDRENNPGNCHELTLTLGNGISFTADQTKLVSETGPEWIAPSLASIANIATMTHVSITKGGDCLTNNRVGESSGIISSVTGLNYHYENSEDNAVVITGIDIIINDRVIYSHSGLNIDFSRAHNKSLNWDDQSIYQNSSFKQMLMDQNCDTVN